MNPPPNTKPRVHPLARLSGIVAAILGVLVLLSRSIDPAIPIGLRPPLMHIYLFSALGLLLSGLALALADIRRRLLPRLLAALAIAIGAVSLVGELLPSGVGLGRLQYALPYMAGGAIWQPPLVAAAVILVGVAVIIRTAWQALRYPSVWLGLLGTVTAAFGLLPLFGHLAGAEPAHLITGVRGIALQVAVVLVLFGIGLFAEAARLMRFEREPAPSPWLPLSATVGALLLAALLWQALEAWEATQFARNSRIEARTIRSAIISELRLEIDTLVQMAEQLGERQQPPAEPWRIAARLLVEQRQYLGFAWVDDQFTVRQAVPIGPNARFIGRNLARDPAQWESILPALKERRPEFSQPIPHATGYGFLAYIPVYWGTQFAGFMIAVFDVQSLAEHLLRDELERGYGIALFNGGQLIYRSQPLPESKRFLVRLPLQMWGLSWQVVVWPLAGLRESAGTLLPELVLGIGALLAGLLGFALRAKQLLEHSSARIRKLNADLEQRVAQRTSELVASNRKLAREAMERERVADELAHLARHDPLTGLPNRMMFEEHLQRAIHHAARDQQSLAVFFLDLDNFKDINDTLGHASGDLLLRLFAERLRSVLRDTDIICRQGGDEFLILAEDLPHTYDCAAVAEKILEVMKQKFRLGDSEVYISTSIGIATYPESGTDAEALVKHADSAMYQAKAAGRNTFAMYSTRLHRIALRRLDMKRNLHLALDRGEFTVHYQPQVELRSGRVVGAEALLRWPQNGRMIPPSDFIPLTEEMGLIVPIGSLVIQLVCNDLACWKRRGLPLPQLCVNVSAAQFRNDRLLRDLQAYADDGLAPYLGLELTERVFIEDSEAHRRLLQEVERMGIVISIDDFGTGCSSFAYFRYFPIHIVKIDQSFIQNVTCDTTDAKITESVLDLAQNFQLKVIAEGVETAAQMEFLRERQCDVAQGFYFSRPVPREEFLALWQQQVEA